MCSGQSRDQDLLERADDQAAIERVLATARDGAGAAIVVEAAAGLGKTSLLGYAASTGAQAGMQVLSASGDMAEQDLPWGVMLQLFPEHFARELDASPGDPVLSNPLPILHRIHGIVADLTDAGPVLLSIDDLHWADPQSLQCVRYLVRRIHHLRVAVIAAVRSGSQPDEVAATLERISVAPGHVHRALAPLPDRAIGIIARRCVPSAAEQTIRAITHAVGGNPFLCHEIAAQWDRVSEPHPDGGIRVGGDLHRLNSWTRMRLDEAGPSTLQTAQAVAVLGRMATASNIASVAEIAPADVDECLDSLHRSGFLRVGHRIGFSHPVLREVVYSATGPALLQGLHYRCARLLADHGAVQEAASHLLASGTRHDDWELGALRDAARADLVAAAPDRAVRFLHTALQLAEPADRGQVLLELGRAELQAGDAAAGDHLREALQTLGDRPASVLQQAGDWLYSCSQFSDAAHAYQLGLDNLTPDADRVQEARLIAGLHSAHLFSGVHPDRTYPVIPATLPHPPPNPDAAERILLSIAAGEATLGMDRPRDSVLALARRAAGDDQPDDLGRAVLEPLAAAFVSCDEFIAAKGLLDGFIEAAQIRGEHVANCSLKAIRSLCCFRMGKLDQAEYDAGDVLELAGTHPAARAHVVAACRTLALTHLERGDLEAAARSLHVDAEQLWGESWLAGLYLDAKGRVDLARGSAEDAVDAFVGAGARFTASGGTGGWIDWRCGAAVAADRAGDPDAAREWAEAAHKLAIRFGVATRVASALRTLALLEQDPAAQAGLLREAASQLQASGAVLDYARVLVELGSAQRRMGRRRDCRETLRQGRDIAQRCGARALMEFAADELEASGARRPALAVTGAGALTPAERRVAELAATGRTNREIAESLFVSRKTVETHLGSVYRKLQISGRGDLANQRRDPAQSSG